MMQTLQERVKIKISKVEKIYNNINVMHIKNDLIIT